MERALSLEIISTLPFSKYGGGGPPSTAEFPRTYAFWVRVGAFGPLPVGENGAGDVAAPPERSRKASEGEKDSGLLWWGGLSFEALECATEGVFFRTGLIHGGRLLRSVGS